MRRRKSEHKSYCNNEKHRSYNVYVYQFIRENGGWDNWDMIEVERYNAIDGNDARKRERYWFEELKATLNIETPNRTKKEYNEYYKEKKAKEYREKNKERDKEKNKEWRKNNKEYLYKKHKEWCENNRDKLKEYENNRRNNLMSQKSISSIIQ
jgi:hypothetical protein